MHQLRQEFRQKLEQYLQPQQILRSELIQLPLLELELRVRTELQENPFLDELPEDEAIVEKERPALPPGLRIEISNDQSLTISRMVNELENSIMTGMFLVVVCLFMFFGVKNSLLISTRRRFLTCLPVVASTRIRFFSSG